jgi:hypothetical protein
LLGAAAPGTLHQQDSDEPTLDDEQADRSDNVAPVELPQGWLPEHDDTPGGQESTIDPPSLDLPIVKHGKRGAVRGWRRALPREDA